MTAAVTAVHWVAWRVEMMVAMKAAQSVVVRGCWKADLTVVCLDEKSVAS